MQIIESDIQGAKSWRVLVVLSPDEALGIQWQFGLALAKANNGTLLAAVTIPTAVQSALDKARTAVNQIRAQCSPNNGVRTLIVADDRNGRDIEKLVQDTRTDLLLTCADGPVWHDSLNHVSCAVAVMRGTQPMAAPNGSADAYPDIQRILVPTSSGPNAALALRLLLPLTTNKKITAFYVANNAFGPNQESLGWSRLREALRFAGASERIQSKVAAYDSIIEGIVDEAADYDLVVLGASRESRLDKALFGDIPGAVVRHSQTPVVIVRQPKNRIEHLTGQIAWRLRNLLPHMKLSQRTDIYVRIRRSARPNSQFFILIALSAMIAALGLIVDSPAVVIGAMLVAPLMSPIVGSGLAIVLGDARFLRLSLGSVLRGVVLAIGVGAISGLIHLDQPLTSELLARTEPTLLDLAIALFSGLAGAYALSHSDAAGALPGVAIAAALVPPLVTVGISLTTGFEREALGALLLFTTNFVAISSATALVFLILGFRPKVSRHERHSARARSVRVAMLLLGIVAALLTITTARLAQNSKMESHIRNVIYQSVLDVADAQLVSLAIDGDTTTDGAPLQMELVARSTETIPHETVVALQRVIGIRLQRKVGLTLTVILVTELDPVVPPTLTPTLTPTSTFTPGPSPTTGPTWTPEPSATALVWPTATPTISVTATMTATATMMVTDTAVPPPASPVEPTITNTAVPTITPTPIPQSTETAVPTPVNTAPPTETATSEPTITPEMTPGPRPTATLNAAINGK